MKYRITTDTHFNHGNIKEYCNRPENYESLIVSSFKSLKPNHVLVHLGDICLGNDLHVHEKYIIPIKCKKILVLGNHDRKSNNWYLEHGWDFVCSYFSFKRAHKNILFSHSPMSWDGTYDLNIHGHLHNLTHRKNELIKNLNQHLISLEYCNYKLIDLDTLLNK